MFNFNLPIVNLFVDVEILQLDMLCLFCTIHFTIFPTRLHSYCIDIDRNCDVLPLSLDDLLNYTTLMLKFCTNKRIWASLLRQVSFFGGERGHFKGVTLHPRATDFQEKKAVFFGGGGKGAFCPKKGCNASSIHGLQISKKKNPPQAQSK